MLMQLTDFFNSLPLRSVLAFFTALFLSLACGEKLIGFLHRHQATTEVGERRLTKELLAWWTELTHRLPNRVAAAGIT